VIGAVTIYASLAVGIAAVIGLLSWTTEVLFGRHIGVYVSYLSMAALAACAVFLVYADQTRCSEGSRFQDCEWGGLVTLLVGVMALVAFPAIVVSTVLLKKWSQNKRPQLT
jgi:hypothetical protein